MVCSHTQLTRGFSKIVVSVGALIVFLFSVKPAKAAQTLLRVEIPPQVIVNVKGQTIMTIYSNLGRLPNVKEIIWKDQGQVIAADDSLIQKFFALSVTLDWQKVGTVYKHQTILEKIVSLLS